MVLNTSQSAGTSSSSSALSAPRKPAMDSSKSSSKFSFDKFFFSSKRSKHKRFDQPEALEPTKRDPSSSSSFFTKKTSHDAPASAVHAPGSPYRPPPIATNQSRLAKVQQTASATSNSSNANVRLYQSPGGRSNVQLAIPVTPPSTTSKARAAAQKLKLASKRKHSQQRAANSRLSRHDASATDGLRASAIYGRFSSASSRGSAAFSLGPWRESTSSALALTSSRASLFATASSPSRQSTVESFLASLPRDLVVDVMTVCAPRDLRPARAYVRHLLQVHIFAIRSTKWAAYFLQLVTRARTMRRLSSSDAVSLRWVICACVQHEVHARRRTKELVDQAMHKKMTEYRVALQCISGTTVLKYGRKGKPHQTQLVIENGESFRWTSKLLSKSKKHKKAIALASVLAIRAGPTTDVLTRALQKGTLALQDAKCTMSLVTATRTFDIKAKSAAEREWLHRSFTFLVELAREHEKRVAQQVELSIMKRMETLSVWKHGRKGRPHKTHIVINRFGEISWRGRSGDSIQLDEIVAIELGPRTQVFRRALQAGHVAARTSDCCCFSLVSRTRTLDIETANEHMRDWFVVAFRYLMDKVQEKTAAIKREKAEKQLKLLQELCGSMGIATASGSAPAPVHAHA